MANCADSPRQLTEETAQLEKEVNDLNVKQAILKADIAKLKVCGALPRAVHAER